MCLCVLQDVKCTCLRATQCWQWFAVEHLLFHCPRHTLRERSKVSVRELTESEKSKGRRRRGVSLNFYLRINVCVLHSCKFSHDAENYLKNKPADISDHCVFFAANGRFKTICFHTLTPHRTHTFTHTHSFIPAVHMVLLVAFTLATNPEMQTAITTIMNQWYVLLGCSSIAL